MREVPAFELDRVSKAYRTRSAAKWLRRQPSETWAIRDISMRVGQGEFVGYLGANGAGKSTTVKILTGILVPTNGFAFVCGRDPFKHRAHVTRGIGAVFGHRTQLWWDLPLRDSFTNIRYMYAMERADYSASLAELVDLLDLSPIMGTPVRQLSLGLRIKGELAAAMLHRPRLLLLDEPTIGLDVLTKDVVRAFLRECNRERGTTILLTTHDLADADKLCTRLVIIDAGELVSDGSIADLLHRYRLNRRLVIELHDVQPPLAVAGATVISVEGSRQILEFPHGDGRAPEIIAAVARNASVRDLRIEEPGVEAIVRAVAKQRKGTGAELQEHR